MHHPVAALRVLLLVWVCVACANELAAGPATGSGADVAGADVVPMLDAVVDVAADTATTDAWPAFGCTPGHDETCNWLPGACVAAGAHP